MATVSQKLITAEEFARMPSPPDGSRQELVRGVIETMPPPGGLHGVCCAKISRRLGNFADDGQRGNVTCNDTGFITERDPDTVRGADIAFWSFDRLPEVPEGYIEIAPDLAVEVVSPGDHYSRIRKRIQEHLKRGVRLLWIVDPADRSITVYRSSQQETILEENDTITGEDVLAGFSCKVSDLLP